MMASLRSASSLRPLVASFGFPLLDPLLLSPATVCVVLPDDCSQHVEHHPIKGFEHPRGDYILGSGHHPRRRQVEGDDTNSAGLEFGLELLPVFGIEAGKAVNLFNEEDVSGMAIGKEPEQLTTLEAGSLFILDVPGSDLQSPSLGRMPGEQLWHGVHLVRRWTL